LIAGSLAALGVGGSFFLLFLLDAGLRDDLAGKLNFAGWPEHFGQK
jgi:hypothetical protein